MAHIGVGAFHRCHQAEYTDDLLARRFDRWGVVGINIRDPQLRRHARAASRALHAPDPARTTASRRASSAASSRVVDSQDEPGAGAGRAGIAGDRRGHPDRHGKGLLPHAVERRAGPRPSRHRSRPRRSRSAAQPARPDRAGAGAAHEVARPSAHADELRQHSGATASILANVVQRDGGQARTRPRANGSPPTPPFRRAWSTASRRQHRTADIEMVEQSFGYRDHAVVVGEPFRQWVIERRFAGRVAAMGSGRRDLRRRRDAVRAPQDARPQRCAVDAVPISACWPGYEHTCDDMADPLLQAFVRRMLIEETPADAASRCRASTPGAMSSRASIVCATPRSATAITRSPPTARRRSSSGCSIRSASGCGAARAWNCCRCRSRRGWSI